MDTDEFIKQLRKEVLTDGMVFYRELFENKEQHTVGDEYWLASTKFFAELNEVQKETLLLIVRQVTVDTLATVLGIIDGVCHFEGASGELQLLLKDGTKLSGELQERFFIQEHEEGFN